jgi:hypothetical protein
MTVDERLISTRIKIERAKKHLHDLEVEVRSFLDSQPYRIGIKRDPQTRRPVYYLLSVQDTPLSIAAITGDVIQNLRSALDHLAYQLAIIGPGGKGSLRRIYFPISKNEADYKTQKSSKVRGMRPDAIKAIDALKPYRGGNDMLWHLHELNNVDKHRLLITVGSAYNSVNVGPTMHRIMKHTWNVAGFDDADIIPMPDLFIKPADRLFPLKAGDELFSDVPDAEADEKIQFRFEIAFGEPHIVEGKPLIETLQQMIELVDNIILRFRPLLV